MNTKQDGVWWGLWLLVAVPMVPGLWMWAGYPLLPDEAYYWVWGQRPEWSYFDHPPLVGWLIGAATWLLGDATWVVRLPALAGWLAAGWFVYAMARRLFAAPHAGLLALGVWSTMPMLQAGLHVVTPDSPMAAFLGLTYWCAVRVFQGRGGQWWALTGVAVGAAMLSKYTGVLPLGAFLIAMLTRPALRPLLATPGPWLGVLAAFVVFFPVTLWNATHDWVSFAFQLGHGVKTENPGALSSLGTFVGGQLGVATPWLLAGMVWAAIRAVRGSSETFAVRGKSGAGASTDGDADAKAMLGWGLLLPLGLLSLAALTTAGEANWPLVAYLPGAVLLGGALAGWRARLGAGGRRGFMALAVLAVLLATLLVNALRFPQALPALGLPQPKARTQLTHAHGWARAALEADAARAELRRPWLQAPGDGGCTLLAASYQDASAMAWHLGIPHAVRVTPQSRVSQYNLWGAVADEGNPEPACLHVRTFRRENAIPDVMYPTGGRAAGGATYTLLRHWRADNPDGTVRFFAIFMGPPPR